METQVRTDTRARIVRAAMELFHRVGYTPIGVSEICAYAGISKSSLYHFFSSKEALALGVLDARWAEVHDTFCSLIQAPIPPLAKIRRSFEAVFGADEQNRATHGAVLGCPFGSLGSELAATEPAVRKRVAGILDELADIYRTLLEQAIASGDLPPDYDAAAGAGSLVTALQGMSVIGRVFGSSQRMRSEGHRLVELIIAVPHYSGNRPVRRTAKSKGVQR